MFLLSCGKVCGSCAVVDSFAPGVERIREVVEILSSTICKCWALRYLLVALRAQMSL